ncbi:hypothetical protein [Streptomyces pinistramenti]|uniref:hypothetical protein n=1 Tax=Streptomyces pinistramenti TaxID=2884812 RepID=UPI001D071511|nr:hypothetical protein [Streptomyces pinistramenti]MCB5910676.1 hypothetical protein [Streptomyces pinistramenti]
MAGQRGVRHPSRAGRAGCAVLFLALLAQLTGCAGGAPAQARHPDVQRMLADRARAVSQHDEAAFLASVDPRHTGYYDRQRRMFGNLAGLPLTGWRYDLVSTDAFPLPSGGGRLAAKVKLSYRLKGYDAEPVTSEQYLTLTRHGGRWRIASDTDAAAAGHTGTRQLWDQGPVRMVRGRHSLVLGGAADPGRLRDLAKRADAAVPAASSAWKGAWTGQVVVEAPDSVVHMAQLLGSGNASGYTGIAAVTTGEAGAAAKAPADRVIVNPDAYEELNDLGRAVVLTHEITHVATRTATTGTTPLWLSEGFADWVAYRGRGRSAGTTAPELSRAVAAGRPPRQLPADEDFGFTGGADRLATAYEGGWLACRMIAGKWGEAKLRAFYRAAGQGAAASGSNGPAAAPSVGARALSSPSPRGGTDDHRQPAGRNTRLDQAMRAQLGIGVTEFTRQWRAYVKGELS